MTLPFWSKKKIGGIAACSHPTVITVSKVTSFWVKSKVVLPARKLVTPIAPTDPPDPSSIGLKAGHQVSVWPIEIAGSMESKSGIM